MKNFIGLKPQIFSPAKIFPDLQYYDGTGTWLLNYSVSELEALPYNLISLNIAVATQSHNVCLSKIYVQSFCIYMDDGSTALAGKYSLIIL